MWMCYAKLNTGSWLFVLQTPQERNYVEASSDARASYLNTWTSHGFFMLFELYASPTHISLHMYTQLQQNMFCVLEFAPRHILRL